MGLEQLPINLPCVNMSPKENGKQTPLIVTNHAIGRAGHTVVYLGV